MKNYVAPGGMHVRVDSGLYTGYRVPPYYDSMIGKLIVYGSTRESCITRLRRALEEFVVEGMKTTIPLHQKLVRDPEFLAGDYTIKWLEAMAGERSAESPLRASAVAPAVMPAVAVLVPAIVVPIAAGPDKSDRRQRPAGVRGSATRMPVVSAMHARDRSPGRASAGAAAASARRDGKTDALQSNVFIATSLQLVLRQRHDPSASFR